jgi:AraC family transcriptional regulator, regulatory protein of adaptative response / methylated-DNA-[protein]-cysteine methyltransferase
LDFDMSLGQTESSASHSPIIGDPRWLRLIARDKSADGQFWYSVATTGVYCRPSCPSRTANPKNVQFHNSTAEARKAGFRACKRCNPDGLSVDAENAVIITKACRLIEESPQTPSLAQLANEVQLSPAYFHRLFKRVTGLTPKGYGDARRAQRAREQLGSGGTVTEAIYGAGFNSASRFYAVSTDVLGMTPRNFRAGGAMEHMRYAFSRTSLGHVLVAATDKGISAILIGESNEDLTKQLQRSFPKARLVEGDQAFGDTVSEVIKLVEAPRNGFDLPLDVRGTAFQQRVWQALRGIPAGETRSYAEIAEGIGSPNATRAVAGACASNVLAVAIPCHRVIRHDGSLSGYRWGVERKRELLQREARPKVEASSS